MYGWPGHIGQNTTVIHTPVERYRLNSSSSSVHTQLRPVPLVVVVVLVERRGRGGRVVQVVRVLQPLAALVQPRAEPARGRHLAPPRRVLRTDQLIARSNRTIEALTL